MNFKMNEAIEILEQTPQTLDSFLSGLSEGWLQCNEGEGTWNAVEVLGHLIEAEKLNFLPRLQTILQEGQNKFPPFDRFAHLSKNVEQSIQEMIKEFKTLRSQNLARLKEIMTCESQFEETGIHPELGEVKARELLSTWVVHDLTHISQIVRVMAERYREDVGPWINFLSVLKK